MYQPTLQTFFSDPLYPETFVFVSCLDIDGIFIRASRSLYTFTKKHQGYELVVYGHTSSAGVASYNYDLSEWRVKGLLDNGCETFLDIVDFVSRIEDC